MVCRWIERNLCHGEGDYFGQPIRLRPWQRALIYEAYELLPDGSRAFDRVIWGLPKGQGKTELAAMMAWAEFAGPVVFDGWNADGSPRGRARLSPEIPVAAASFDQADLVFGACVHMARNGAVKPFCEAFDTEILLKGKPGALYRVAAALGTNDGKRPTFLVCDELHEWEGKKARVYTILSNGRAKRKDSWELIITTAGWDKKSLLGKLYDHGKDVVAGKAKDDRLCFRWFEADAKEPDPDNPGKEREIDLKVEANLERAIRQANPAIGDFLAMEAVKRRFFEMPEFEFRRYHLNQWSSAPERWLAQGVWERCARFGPAPEPGERVALGFDGSWSGDSTGLVGVTLDDDIPRLFVVDAWQKAESDNPEHGKDDEWRVDVGAVENAIRAACEKWNVVAVACDPHRWQRTISVLNDEGLPMVEWPSHSAAFMVPACQQFYEAVTNVDEQKEPAPLLEHDGDERLAKHVNNAIVKIDARGPRVMKESKDSPRRVDLLIAALAAYDMAVRHRQSDQELGVEFVGHQ